MTSRWKKIWADFWGNKSRTLLTILTIMVGTLAVEEFVNADVIARGISGFAPEGSAVRAGRIMLARIRELVARGRGRDVDEVLDKELWRKIRATRDHLGTTEVDPGAHDRG